MAKGQREDGHTDSQFKALAGWEQSVVDQKHHAGSGTGCWALQWMTGCAPGSSSSAQRTARWHQRAANSSLVSVGSRPRSQSLSTPAVSRMLAAVSRQSASRAFLQDERMRAATAPGVIAAASD